MNNLKKLLCIFAILLTINLTISANELENADANIKFTVEALIPENQIDKDSTYFHLLLNETHKQTLRVKAINLRNEKVTIVASANNATTNSNGVIEYGPNRDINGQTSQKPDFETIVKVVNEKEELAPYEEREFLFELDMNDTRFEGVILGGFYFEVGKDTTENAGIGQTYSYSISAALSQNESYLKSSKTLDLLSVKPQVKDGYKYIGFEFENQEANILTDLNLNAKIYDEFGTVIKFEKNQESMEMAPQTKMNFNLDIGKKDLASGTYRYVVEGTSFKQEWHWENTFTIASDEAKQINNESINKVRVPDYIKYAMTISIVLTLINAGLIVNESRKKKEETQ